MEVICSTRMVSTVQRAVKTKPESRSGEHAVFFVSGRSLNGLSEMFEIGQILDRYWVITDPDPASNETMLASFFNGLADIYAGLIDVERNELNVRHLLHLLTGPLGAPSGAILDFGCGPGNSLPLIRLLGRSALGIDLSSKMREEAARAGMMTIEPSALGQLPKDYLGGAIASYVLHLDPRPRELATVLGVLAPGGVFVGNFHKDRGLSSFLEYVDDLGAEARILPGPSSNLHGTYVGIRHAG